MDVTKEQEFMIKKRRVGESEDDLALRLATEASLRAQSPIGSLAYIYSEEEEVEEHVVGAPAPAPVPAPILNLSMEDFRVKWRSVLLKPRRGDTLQTMTDRYIKYGLFPVGTTWNEVDADVPMYMLAEDMLPSRIPAINWEQSPARHFLTMIAEVKHESGSAAETVEGASHNVWKWLEASSAPEPVLECMRMLRNDGLSRAHHTVPQLEAPAFTPTTSQDVAVKASTSFKETLEPLLKQPRATGIKPLGGFQLPILAKYAAAKIDTKHMAILYFADGSKTIGCASRVKREKYSTYSSSSISGTAGREK